MAIKKIKPILVIICGGSGSGKTTVAELISKELPKGYTSTILSLDNFYLPKDRITTSNYDTPEAIDWFAVKETLDFLVKKRASFDVPIYDFKTKTNKKTMKIKAADVVIFEGILSLQDKDIRDMADIKIFIDVPDDERLIRRIIRDIKSRGSDILNTVEMWRQNVIKMHHEFVEPHKWNADFIIPWASSKENLVPIKAIGGALEYMIFSTTREWTKKTSKTKTI